ncbi:uncharacterized protein LOC105838944 [Monomorium pharaonis]|uniref:uncharacterized protein LOC105838944 n=1 Tax=Monomorium pharaonis TaxID=307658 RepID=UPI00063F4F07|nr:uncharacterized protein LOC105838944 [Monomorium pharaonis]
MVKGACTRIRTYVDSITSITSGVIAQLEERKRKLDDYWSEYNNFQTQLEILDENECNDRINFEDAFYALSAKIRELLTPPSASRQLTAASLAPSTWNLLKNKYDDQRFIVHSHLKAIVDLPVMNKKNASELRQIADGAVRHIQFLKALKRPTDSWDDLLIYLLISKLDTNTTREWQRSLVGDELLTFKAFLDFLVRQYKLLESTEGAKHVTTRHQSNKQKASCHTAIKVKCDYCQGDHLTYQCKQFLVLLIPQRIDKARSKKMCLNCLCVATHTSSKCPSGRC